MAIPNISTYWSQKPSRAQSPMSSLSTYISEYDKHRRYYYRDLDDRYQVDSNIQQQFESIYGNTNKFSS